MRRVREGRYSAGVTVETIIQAKPFLKWAGGKTKLLPALRDNFPPLERVKRYFEPFLGAGALFFDMRAQAPTVPARINDTNPDLIEVFRVLQDSPEALIERLKEHEACHCTDHYYGIRALAELIDPVERASRTIYLNRTCFNGLYRVNRKGQFNVPMGRYKNPKICDEENLWAVHRTLQGVEICQKDFEDVVADAGEGDFIYFDPPYQPVSKTSDFTSYTKDGFGQDEQDRLAQVFDDLSRRGAWVILSNSWCEMNLERYHRYRVEQVMVNRNINSKASGRGAVPEVMVLSKALADELPF